MHFIRNPAPLPIRILRGAVSPASAHRHLQGDAAFQLIGHDAGQHDKHPPGSACSDSDASCRFGLAIQC